MGTIKRRGLAVCMAALLMLSGLTAAAAEPLQAESENALENAAAVSGGNADTDVETPGEMDSTEKGNLSDIVGTQAEDQITAYAADDIASGTDGDITWVIDASGKLTVTGTGDLSGAHYESGFAWRPYSDQIISAELNVTGMTDASWLFYGCSNLRSLDIRGFNTSSVADMTYMFSGCSGLTSLDIRGFNTSSVADMSYMFSGCSGLTSLDVSGFDTSSVTNMSYMFSGCSGLTNLDVSGFDTSSVTNMSYMFSGCSGLTNLDVSGFDTNSVTDLGGMFSGCSGLTSLDISGFDTSNVMRMRGMFLGCSGLTSLDISSFDTSSVTNMSDMFSGCSGLTSLDIRGFDTSSVTNMSYVFFGCSGLTSLDIRGFDTSSVTDMIYMFSECSGLTSLDIRGFDTSSVTDMIYMFSGCSGLTSLDIRGFDTSNVIYMSDIFSGCSGLTSLDVSGFDTSNVTNMGGMFSGCSGLTSLDVSGFDTSNVTDMYNMFSGCNGLTSLDVSGFGTNNVTHMYSMFSGCSGLMSLDVSGFDTSHVTDMGGMFSGCSGLTSLDVRGFDTSSVKYMLYMFSGCSGLTSLDVRGFDTSHVTHMYSMFEGCSGLTSLDVSGFDTSSVTDMGGMFEGCNDLTTIQSPYNVNTSAPLPVVTGAVWTLPDGTEVTELPQGLSNSVTLTRSGIPTTPQITTTTPDLNMEDVVRVKYVPYSYTVETNNTDPDNTVTFSIVEGELAEGLQMYPATGEIYGVPLEAGEFKIKVMATYSNPAYLPSYAELTLTVLDNTDGNVGVATDSGYDITQPVIGFDTENMEGSSAQTLVSQGEYSQFRDVYIDGRKLTAEQDYTSQAGSTRITILNQTLASGGEGTHTLGIVFRTEDGTLKRAAQNYVIGKNVVGDNAGSNNGGSGDTENNNSSNSDNGNNSNNSNINSSLLPTTISSQHQQDFIIYTVERGDSLWKIAARFYGQGSSWRRIYEDNMAVIKNPHRLYAGQKLIIRLAGLAYPVQETPAPVSEAAVSEGTAYRVQKGDRLWTIAYRAYGSGRLWNIIYEANKDVIADPERIREGLVIIIPQR